jgi:hypothetical protein
MTNALKFGIIGFGGLLAAFSMGTQLYVWVTMYGVASQINRSIDEMEQANTPDPSFRPDLEITGTSDGSYVKDGYVAMTSLGKLNDSRVVSVESYVRLEDLLDPGEKLPERDLLSAFTTARAVRVADEECARLLETLASRCVVAYTNASPVENGLAQVGVTMKFIQKSDFGSVKADKRASYVEVDQNLIGGGAQDKTVSLGGSGNARSAIYERAVDFCAKMRSTEGNCAITNVYIRSTPYNGSMQTISASGKFSALEPL